MVKNNGQDMEDFRYSEPYEVLPNGMVPNGDRCGLFGTIRFLGCSQMGVFRLCGGFADLKRHFEPLEAIFRDAAGKLGEA